MKFDRDTIKTAAQGRWLEILERVGIARELLDGRHHPCPECGGKDRFRLLDEAAGAVICNQCFDKSNGDGFAAVMWFTSCDFPAALATIADILGIAPSNEPRRPQDPMAWLSSAKRITPEAIRRYGGQLAERDGAPVVRFPVTNGDGENHSHFDIGPGSDKLQKGLLKAGKGSSGLFFPQTDDGPRLPQKGETWLKAEGVKDSCVLAALDLLAVGINGMDLSRKFVSLFAGVNVLIVYDRTSKALQRTQRNAKRLLGMAASVSIVHLPLALDGNEGDDIRDLLAKQDGEQLLRQAIATAEPVAVGGDGLPTIANFEEFTTTDAKGNPRTGYAPLAMSAVLQQVRDVTGGWPRRIESALFVHDDNGVCWLESHASFFGWLQSVSRVPWRGGAGFVSKPEAFAELTRTARNYEMVEPLPHEPPIAGYYYACETPEPGDGQTLRELVSFFKAESGIDTDLILSAFVTPGWGGAPGQRPAYMITSDLGRGVGKTTLAELVGRVWGGAMSFSVGEDIDKMRTRILSPNALRKRVAIIDNVKTFRLSWGDFEQLITTTTIDGKRMYVGDFQRPNTLTWFVTANGASLSKDLAQRCVTIKLLKPEHSATWRMDVERFIDENRAAIIADAIAFLRSERSRLDSYSRWGDWDRDILQRLPEPNEAAKVIGERQKAVDADNEESDLIESAFRSELDALTYDTASDVVFVPNTIATQWVNAAMNDRSNTTRVTQRIKQACQEGQIKRLKYKRLSSGRGFLWIGADAPLDAETRFDIETRIAERVAHR